MMVGKSNQNVFLIHIDASGVAEFKISELEISRFDCSYTKYYSIERLINAKCMCLIGCTHASFYLKNNIIILPP